MLHGTDSTFSLLFIIYDQINIKHYICRCCKKKEKECCPDMYTTISYTDLDGFRTALEEQKSYTARRSHVRVHELFLFRRHSTIKEFKE